MTVLDPHVLNADSFVRRSHTASYTQQLRWVYRLVTWCCNLKSACSMTVTHVWQHGCLCWACLAQSYVDLTSPLESNLYMRINCITKYTPHMFQPHMFQTQGLCSIPKLGYGMWTAAIESLQCMCILHSQTRSTNPWRLRCNMAT